jgi:hypothetical protein
MIDKYFFYSFGWGEEKHQPGGKIFFISSTHQKRTVAAFHALNETTKDYVTSFYAIVGVALKPAVQLSPTATWADVKQ